MRVAGSQGRRSSPRLSPAGEQASVRSRAEGGKFCPRISRRRFQYKVSAEDEGYTVSFLLEEVLLTISIKQVTLADTRCPGFARLLDLFVDDHYLQKSTSSIPRLATSGASWPRGVSVPTIQQVRDELSGLQTITSFVSEPSITQSYAEATHQDEQSVAKEPKRRSQVIREALRGLDHFVSSHVDPTEGVKCDCARPDFTGRPFEKSSTHLFDAIFHNSSSLKSVHSNSRSSSRIHSAWTPNSSKKHVPHRPQSARADVKMQLSLIPQDSHAAVPEWNRHDAGAPEDDMLRSEEVSYRQRPLTASVGRPAPSRSSVCQNTLSRPATANSYLNQRAPSTQCLTNNQGPSQVIQSRSGRSSSFYTDPLEVFVQTRPSLAQTRHKQFVPYSLRKFWFRNRGQDGIIGSSDLHGSVSSPLRWEEDLNADGINFGLEEAKTAGRKPEFMRPQSVRQRRKNLPNESHRIRPGSFPHPGPSSARNSIFLVDEFALTSLETQIRLYLRQGDDSFGQEQARHTSVIPSRSPGWQRKGPTEPERVSSLSISKPLKRVIDPISARGSHQVSSMKTTSNLSEHSRSASLKAKRQQRPISANEFLFEGEGVLGKSTMPRFNEDTHEMAAQRPQCSKPEAMSAQVKSADGSGALPNRVSVIQPASLLSRQSSCETSTSSIPAFLQLTASEESVPSSTPAFLNLSSDVEMRQGSREALPTSPPNSSCPDPHSSLTVPATSARVTETLKQDATLIMISPLRQRAIKARIVTGHKAKEAAIGPLPPRQQRTRLSARSFSRSLQSQGRPFPQPSVDNTAIVGVAGLPCSPV